MHTRTSKFGGRDATFSIAAADASAKSKRDADYICDGVADEDQFVAAIAKIAAMPSANGKIIASEGTFRVTGKTAGSIPLISNLEIEIIGKVIFTSPTPDGSKMFYGNAVHDVSIVGGALDGNVSDVSQIDGYRTLVYLTGACYNIKIDSSMQNVAASRALGTEFSTKNGANVSKTPSCHSIQVTNRNFPNILQLADFPDNYRSEELISNCSSGWSFVGAGAGYSTTKYLVDHSLYLTGVSSAYSVLSAPIDFTHRMIHFMMYIPACTRGSYTISCDLFNNVSNAYVRYTYSITANENLFDRWIHVACRPETVGSGVVDYRVIDKIRFSTNIPGVYVGKVWSTIEPESFITLSFDDGLSAVEGYTAVLDAHGMHGVYGIVSLEVESYTGRLSWARLSDMSKIGHEIVNHSYDHFALNYDSAARCEIAGLGGQDSLVNHSFVRGARFLILPYTGLISSEGYDALRDHMVFISTIPGRGSVSGAQSTYRYRRSLAAGAVATIKSEIDSVFRSGGCLDLYAHAPDTYGNMSVSEFHQIVDYITQLGIPVVTYSELYDSIFRKSREFTLHTDHYFNILAASANYIRSNEDLSVATPITFTLDAQPDIPRALSWAFDSHAQITAYTMEVVGIDGQGRNITETWTQTAGWSGETSNAFTSIASIKMTSRTGTGVGDTMDVGITNTIGLRKKLLSVDHLQTIKKNNVSQTIVVADTSSKYGTYDLDAIGVVDTDDIEMTYKTM